MVCIFLKNPNYITEQAFLIFAERSCLNFLTCKKLVNWGNGHNSRYFFYISIVHCNKLSRFWFSQLSHKYQVRFATNIRSCGSQTARKPLAEMIALINWSAMALLLVKRGGGEIWQSISGKPNVQTNFFWKPVIIHRQKSLDEPPSLLSTTTIKFVYV